ncbi:cytochrome-c peroxidase [Flavobacteriaceae bacterium]|nr:cytochrome-c peroxidase [Flavobacteriaceae bacterium]MDA7724216.1 cytochrome-c peroxidase [Flavobacteriaceae bacterium]MDA7849345.1 cytochrome-c peroxidase [Flavobacteriaceae bacterium]MDG1310263.1 cytochrome c peroxidase [Flavobacteriaceae bacterium]|tara:strand:+ start:8863 stop:10056 length:1194 start_codon:yes stop_codon:yes gene_type:complete
MSIKKFLYFSLFYVIIYSCSSNNNSNTDQVDNTLIPVDLSSYFTIDFTALPNYANQDIPNYITKDNTPASNPITDEGAILGRVLFYDTNLSSDNTVACASCHVQSEAFGDSNRASIGINGSTARHSMRLVNNRFANGNAFFWDKRAATLEIQTTQPIQDHIEMGFSGEDGDLSFDDLITKLENIPFYPVLFSNAFGTETISESRIQQALAQFVRSIQSFDSKYDQGRALAANNNQPFPNFSNLENDGKNLYNQPPVFNNNGMRINGGVGCAGCHQGPEFDVDPNSLNNGVIGTIGQLGSDLTNTRAPSLRDVVKQNGDTNGGFMHNGAFEELIGVINHYNQINLTGNNNLDPRLRPGGNPQQLNMTLNEKNALIAFMETLSGADLYTNSKWGNPFID